MGKLHTLRRAIERDPEKWIGWPYSYLGPSPKGAKFSRGQWLPINPWPDVAYRDFVRHVLTELGYPKPKS